MKIPRFERTYDHISHTNAEFALRMFSCLTHVVGRLSEREFVELFTFPNQKQVLRHFKQMTFRGYLQMFMKKPRIERLKNRRFGVKRRYIRRIRAKFCGPWRTPYNLYQHVASHGIDREAFYLWWNGLVAIERFIFLEACLHQIKQSASRVWFDSPTEDARICVQMAGGSESGVPIRF